MGKQTVQYSKGGTSFCTLLAILFIAFKLLGVTTVATWPWWLVLSPLWIPFVIIIAVLVVVLLFAGFCYVLGSMVK